MGIYKGNNFEIVKRELDLSKTEQFVNRITNINKPTVIVIQGFLSEKPNELVKPIKGQLLKTKYKNYPICEVKWESSTLIELGLSTAGGAVRGGVVGAVLGGGANWKKAKGNSEKVANELADYLSSTNKKYIIIGHSLGARIAINTLGKLASKGLNRKVIKDAYLLAGAVGLGGWGDITKAVSGKIYNFYSEEDMVLLTAYKLFEFGEKTIGRNPLNINKVQNKHTGLGHLKYFDNLASMINLRFSFEERLSYFKTWYFDPFIKKIIAKKKMIAIFCTIILLIFILVLGYRYISKGFKSKPAVDKPEVTIVKPKINVEKPIPSNLEKESNYTVVEGDTLYKIAKRKDIYNNSHAWQKIYKANLSTVANPHLILIDQKLNIPKNN